MFVLKKLVSNIDEIGRIIPNVTIGNYYVVIPKDIGIAIATQIANSHSKNVNRLMIKNPEFIIDDKCSFCQFGEGYLV